MSMPEVWITGAGVISALGEGIGAHHDAVLYSKTGLVAVDFFGSSSSDPYICGMVPRDVFPFTIKESASDRADMLAQRAAGEALSCAGLTGGCEADTVIGTTLGNMQGGTTYYQQLKMGVEPTVDLVKKFVANSVAGHLSNQFSLNGKRFTVCSACASGTTAIGTGLNRIRRGECDRVIAGGVDSLSLFVVAGFNSLRLLSHGNCRPFDVSRDGLNPGEASAILVLESSNCAAARNAVPLAKITGFGTALEAFHYTRSHPEGKGVATAINKALSMAGTDISGIDHIHAHGTATVFNDLSEYNGFLSVFGSALSNIPVCSTKSMTGHTFGAAGALSCIFSILTLKEGFVPPTLFHKNKDPHFEQLMIDSEPQKCDARRVLTVSLGFGGEVAALILERP